MSRSPARTRPDDGLITPASAFSRVDLPEPFGPTTEATVPAATETEMPWMMSPAPYPARTSSARRVGGSADKVRLHYLAACPQSGHRPGGQDRSFGHHDHRVAELVHDRQLVLHHEDGYALGAQAEQFGADLAGQPRMHACH